MKFVILLLLSLLAASCTQQTSTIGASMTLDQLLTRHAKARGGKEAIENVQSVNLKAEVTEPEFTVTGHYRATRDGWMRVDIFADGTRVFTEALGPEGGWQMFGDGIVADLSPGGAAVLRRGLIGNLYGIHEISSLGYTLEFIGSDTRNGSIYWDIESTAPDGFSEHIFLDRETLLIASDIETSALHPDLDSTQTQQETFHSDYREIAGVLFSHKSEKHDLDTGEVMQTVIVSDHKVNMEINPEIFSRPSGPQK